MTLTKNSTPRHLRRLAAWTFQRVLIVVIASVGVGVLLYPTAADWFSDRIHATEINGYVNSVKNTNRSQQDALLEAAKKYNAELPAGPLRDPYTLNAEGKTENIGSGSEEYQRALSIDEAGMMGTLNIPSIDVNLPIFHGTDEDTLSKGVGHLFGSSLPVGGTDTHSVLTAHSGFVNATLFSQLHKMKMADVFSITVLNQTIYYKVDKIETVLPEETEDLRQVKGKDYVTLVTCTPIGVNSHRILVRAERIPAPTSAEEQQITLPSTTSDPGFPWWAVIWVASTAAVIVLTRPRTTARRTAG